jgi:hypothetical protein
VRQELERHRAAQTSVFGLIDHTHAPATQHLEDAIVRDCFPDHEQLACLFDKILLWSAGQVNATLVSWFFGVLLRN